MMNTNRFTILAALNGLAPTTAASPLSLFNSRTAVQRLAPQFDRRAADKRVRTILVPLDGSTFAEHALPLAIGIAERCDAVMHLVHVVAAAEVLDPFDALYFADTSLATIKRDKQKYLADVVDRLSAKSSALVDSHVIDGRTVATSLSRLPNLDADLIVMATHGRGLLGRFWHGSVAHSLLQSVSAPQIVVRGTDGPVNLEAQTINHVLLSLDGSKDSEKVLDPLFSLGLFHDVKHTLMHVVPLVPKLVVREDALRTEWVHSQRHWNNGTQYLHPFARTLKQDGRRVHAKVVSSDKPAAQVTLHYAEKLNAGLVAATYPRRWPVTRLLWPNHSEYLFQNSTRPVMFIPA